MLTWLWVMSAAVVGAEPLMMLPISLAGAPPEGNALVWRTQLESQLVTAVRLGTESCVIAPSDLARLRASPNPNLSLCGVPGPEALRTRRVLHADAQWRGSDGVLRLRLVDVEQAELLAEARVRRTTGNELSKMIPSLVSALFARAQARPEVTTSLAGILKEGEDESCPPPHHAIDVTVHARWQPPDRLAVGELGLSAAQNAQAEWALTNAKREGLLAAVQGGFEYTLAHLPMESREIIYQHAGPFDAWAKHAVRRELTRFIVGDKLGREQRKGPFEHELALRVCVDTATLARAVERRVALVNTRDRPQLAVLATSEPLLHALAHLAQRYGFGPRGRETVQAVPDLQRAADRGWFKRVLAETKSEGALIASAQVETATGGKTPVAVELTAVNPGGVVVAKRRLRATVSATTPQDALTALGAEWITGYPDDLEGWLLEVFRLMQTRTE